MQLAAVDLVQPAHVAKEKIALQKHFKAKRDHVLKRLHDIGLDVDIPPTSTFYIWLNLEKLPPPLNNGLVRFPIFRLRISPPLSFTAIFRHSSRNFSKNKLSSSLVSSSTSTLLTDVTCSTPPATTLCAFHSAPLSRILIKVTNSVPWGFSTADMLIRRVLQVLMPWLGCSGKPGRKAGKALDIVIGRVLAVRLMGWGQKSSERSWVLRIIIFWEQSVDG
jgi:hypothetical protein